MIWVLLIYAFVSIVVGFVLLFGRKQERKFYRDDFKDDFIFALLWPVALIVAIIDFLIRSGIDD